MQLKQMEKTDKGLNCSSCKIEVIDFRQRSDEEIKMAFQRGTRCGIFREDQVLNPFENRSISFKIWFRILVLISLMGLNVKPIQAQGVVMKKKHLPKIEKEKSQSKLKNTRKNAVYLKERHLFVRKKQRSKKRRMKNKKSIMGCPSF